MTGRNSALPHRDLAIPSLHGVGRGLGRGVCPIQRRQSQDAPEMSTPIKWLVHDRETATIR